MQVDQSASLLKMSLFHRCFSNIFTSKNQLPGFYVSGTLVENGLNKNCSINIVDFNFRSIEALHGKVVWEEGVQQNGGVREGDFEIKTS